MKSLLFILFTLVCATTAPAEEVAIGHLETNDDAGLNWLQLHCDRTGNQMRCDVFQTLLFHKQVQDEARRTAKSTEALTEFKKEFGDTCPQLLATAPKMEDALKTGIGVDGRKVNTRIATQGMVMMRQLVAACRDPSLERAQALFTFMMHQDEHTCIVHNDYSSQSFQWNGTTGSWTSHSEATGPCGTITIGTLKQDSKNHFCNYVEQHLYTNTRAPAERPVLQGLRRHQAQLHLEVDEPDRALLCHRERPVLGLLVTGAQLANVGGGVPSELRGVDLLAQVLDLRLQALDRLGLVGERSLLEVAHAAELALVLALHQLVDAVRQQVGALDVGLALRLHEMPLTRELQADAPGRATRLGDHDAHPPIRAPRRLPARLNVTNFCGAHFTDLSTKVG